MDRSRGQASGWRSGKSQCAPVTSGAKSSRGTEGRSFGSMSAPQPGIRARRASDDSALAGFSWVYAIRSPESCRYGWERVGSGRGHDERLDAVVELRREDVIALGD